MSKVVSVELLKPENERVPWVEVVFSYLNANYKFIQQGSRAKMQFISGSKPGSEGRSPAPKLPKKVKAKMYEVAAAISRGRYMKLGLITAPARRPKPETAELFPETVPQAEPRPKLLPRGHILRYPPLRNQSLLF